MSVLDVARARRRGGARAIATETTLYSTHPDVHAFGIRNLAPSPGHREYVLRINPRQLKQLGLLLAITRMAPSPRRGLTTS